MHSLDTIAVVGTSLAGLRGIEALRQEGFEGRIVAIGSEPHQPYNRPPLTKQFLKGDWEEDRLELPLQSSKDLDVEWMLGRAALGLELGSRRIELDDGECIDYDGLLIATGASARQLPGAAQLDGIHVLRTLDDARVLRTALAASPRVAVIGAGFIGMEVAATCRQRGLEVAVIEALATPLVRGLGNEIGEYVAGVFREQGVSLHCGVRVAGFEGGDRVEAVRLEGGDRIPADLVIVGVGANPATAWLESSGLELDDGVLCDATCATRAEHVVAAGDVCRWWDETSGRHQRMEHWTNAVEQSAHAARRLLHGPEAGPYSEVPYVWTDQFELRLQIAGEIRPGDQIHVCHGSLEEGRFAALFGREGKLTGVVANKRPRPLRQFRELIVQGASWDEAVTQSEG